jgi:hypothetical protein
MLSINTTENLSDTKQRGGVHVMRTDVPTDLSDVKGPEVRDGVLSLAPGEPLPSAPTVTGEYVPPARWTPTIEGMVEATTNAIVRLMGEAKTVEQAAALCSQSVVAQISREIVRNQGRALSGSAEAIVWCMIEEMNSSAPAQVPPQRRMPATRSTRTRTAARVAVGASSGRRATGSSTAGGDDPPGDEPHSAPAVGAGGDDLDRRLTLPWLRAQVERLKDDMRRRVRQPLEVTQGREIDMADALLEQRERDLDDAWCVAEEWAAR